MGAGVSCSSFGAIKLNQDVILRPESTKTWFKLDPVVLSKEDVDSVLEEEMQKPGTYIVYEDLEKEKTYLAFKTVDRKVTHHPIVKINDLYYFNDFPFPYMESIVLYYQKYKFKDTRLTHQAFLSPYMKSKRPARLCNRAKSMGSSCSRKGDSWEYGHYKKLSTRL